MSNTENKKDMIPSQILFSSLVKKLSRRLRIWQQRVLSLNSEGDIFITRVENKNPSIVLIASSASQQSRSQQSPHINITEQGTVVSPGKRSDTSWPAKLDLRQTLVLSSSSKTYVFLPSVRAADLLKTHMRILKMRQESEEKSDGSDSDSDSVADKEEKGGEVKMRRRVSESVLSLSEIGSSRRDGQGDWRDEVISREWRDVDLTLLTGVERQKSFSLLSLVEFTDVIRSSLSQSDPAKDESKDEVKSQKDTAKKTARERRKESESEKDPDHLEMCLDFTSGPGYLACNKNSLVRDNSVVSMNSLSRRESLLFRPSTHFKPKPILKAKSLYLGEKKETETRVRFNNCPSVRIISSVDSENADKTERDHDMLSHYIYKYVVNSHKLKSDRFSVRKKQA